MQRILITTGLLLALLSCNRTAQENDSTPAAGEEKIVSATIEELLASPADYAGEEVAISGMVTHVCRHGGQKCFVLAGDGETQLRIVPSGDIDEFKIDLEGSTVAFRGTFRVLAAEESQALIEDHESKSHHAREMAHTEAEKADYFIEAAAFREITR